MSDIFFISGIIFAVFTLFLSVFAYFKNYHSRVNRIFFLYGFSLTIVFLTIVFWRWENSAELAVFCLKCFYASAFLSFVIFFHFIAVWLKIIKDKKILTIIFYALALAAIFFVFSPLFIKETGLNADGRAWLALQNYFYGYAAALGAIIFAAFYFLILNYRKSFVSKRAKFKYLILLFFLLIAGIINIFLVVQNFARLPWGIFLLFAGIALCAYIVLAKRAVELSVIFRNLSLNFSAFLSVALCAVILKYLLIKYLPPLEYWADFALLFCALLLFPLIKSLYAWLANKFIFAAYYESEKVIALLNERLTATINVNAIYEIINDLIREIFAAKALGIFNYDKKMDEYIPAYSKDFDISRNKRFAAARIENIFYLKKGQAIVIGETLGNDTDDNDFTLMLKRVKAELIIPVKLKQNIANLIILGAKQSENAYTDQDLRTLEIIGAQAAMAIENALMYQKTKDFNFIMEKEVENATKELRAANEKLKKLDSAKSEFISIASHQLRTPLTVIKGYVSMIMEGNFGPVPENIVNSLNKVYDSNERLIVLVENLLNISRIESGNLQYAFRETDLEELAISAIDELSDVAKKRNNHFVYKPPAKKLPGIIVDSEKIRYVIMNLLDNAVKYSEKSEILVKIEVEKDKLVFSVADEGIGMSDEEISNLFKKFYRGAESPLIHTEGVGLGLYVSKQIIESHQGRIWAKSEGRKKGTIFYFALPISPRLP